MRCSVGVFGGDELHAQPLDAVDGLAVADGLDDIHGVTGEEACGIGDGESELAFLQVGVGGDDILGGSLCLLGTASSCRTSTTGTHKKPKAPATRPGLCSIST